VPLGNAEGATGWEVVPFRASRPALPCASLRVMSRKPRRQYQACPDQPCPNRVIRPGTSGQPRFTEIDPDLVVRPRRRVGLLLIMPSKLVTLGRAGAADGREPAVNLGQLRYIDPQVSDTS
jgi:hypothetical protein